MDSILSQSFTDFELILINDGSRDSSGKICDEYAKKDRRVVVCHKENGGAAAARNEGIRMAKGQYIAFCDSDDYWDDENGLEKVFREVSTSDADLLETRAKELLPSGELKTSELFPDKIMQLKSNDPIEVVENTISCGCFQVAASLKVLRRSFVIANHLFFPEGVTCEDILWAVRIAAAQPR